MSVFFKFENSRLSKLMKKYLVSLNEISNNGGEIEVVKEMTLEIREEEKIKRFQKTLLMSIQIPKVTLMRKKLQMLEGMLLQLEENHQGFGRNLHIQELPIHSKFKKLMVYLMYGCRKVDILYPKHH